MPRTRPPYRPEFRRQIVELLRAGGTAPAVGSRHHVHPDRRRDPIPGAVVDALGRWVVGWAMGAHLRTEVVLKALNMAIQQRHPRGVIHHSDHGSQYTVVEFGKRCRGRDSAVDGIGGGLLRQRAV